MALLKGERPVDVTKACVSEISVGLLLGVNGFWSKLVDPTARVVDGFEVDLEVVVGPVKKISVHCGIQEIFTNSRRVTVCVVGGRLIVLGSPAGPVQISPLGQHPMTPLLAKTQKDL